jgi:predicted peptidase
MGGYGTWSLASKNPGKFAAIAPVCGGIRPPALRAVPAATPVPEGKDPYRTAAEKIGQTPVWIFHGSADPAVPTDESRKMNEALKAAGGNVKYTEYEGVGHNSWDRAYAEPELMTWMLAQRTSPLRAPRVNDSRSRSDMEKYDLVIIGSGPAGQRAAIQGAKSGSAWP